jgi:hypothetical protein
MSLAFIVDGQQEKLVLQRLCTDVPIKTTNLNGKDVKLQVIVKTVASLIRLLKGRYFPVFVIIDREGRPETSEQIERYLREELKEVLDMSEDCIVVSVPDRMLENWIIAGNPMCENDQPLYSTPESNPDGSNGKVLIKKQMRDKKLYYYETGNGVEMCCKMDFKGAANRSTSFHRFYSQIAPYCARLRS